MKIVNLRVLKSIYWTQNSFQVYKTTEISAKDPKQSNGVDNGNF